MVDVFNTHIGPDGMNMVWESLVPSLLPINLDGFDFYLEVLEMSV